MKFREPNNASQYFLTISRANLKVPHSNFFLFKGQEPIDKYFDYKLKPNTKRKRKKRTHRDKSSLAFEIIENPGLSSLILRQPALISLISNELFGDERK